jgi:hypothetical protein
VAGIVSEEGGILFFSCRRVTPRGSLSSELRTFIGSVERGERNVSILDLRLIARVLRVPLGLATRRVLTFVEDHGRVGGDARRLHPPRDALQVALGLLPLALLQALQLLDYHPHPLCDHDAARRRRQGFGNMCLNDPEQRAASTHHTGNLRGGGNDLLLYIAHGLKIPPSRVYGVPTFYHFFSFKPKGEHTCVVCMGTACYVKGAGDVLAALEKETHVKSGETTKDGKVSLLTARCLDACGIAPAVVYDGQVAGAQTVPGSVERVKGWLDHGHC